MLPSSARAGIIRYQSSVCLERGDDSVAGATFAFLIDKPDNRHNTKQSQQQWKILSVY